MYLRWWLAVAAGSAAARGEIESRKCITPPMSPIGNNKCGKILVHISGKLRSLCKSRLLSIGMKCYITEEDNTRYINILFYGSAGSQTIVCLMRDLRFYYPVSFGLFRRWLPCASSQRA